MIRLRTPRLLAALAAALAASPAAAQAVRGAVVDEAGAPVPAATVLLVDGLGTVRHSVLSGPDGGFALRGPREGTYSVRVERVGFAPATATVQLAAGETAELRVRASQARVTLPPVQATTRSRGCRPDPRRTAETAVVWEEARKALTSAALASADARFVYRIRETRRRLDPELRVLHEEDRMVDRTAALRAAPAEQLASGGFIRADRDSVTYYIPDAAVLLSDAFLDGHCFALREGSGATDGLVGLAFEPVGRSSRPSVSGVLWLDRTSAEVRFLEYRYENLRPIRADDRVGGRVEFGRLPGGAWAVQRWYVRMPEIQSQLTRLGSRVTRRIGALVEQGGELVEVIPVSRAGGA
jgi:hypothetical protein